MPGNRTNDSILEQIILEQSEDGLRGDKIWTVKKDLRIKNHLKMSIVSRLIYRSNRMIIKFQ